MTPDGTSGKSRGTVAAMLASLTSVVCGASWIVASTLYGREPGAFLWLLAPALAACAMVLHRLSVGNATGFPGWAAAISAGGGLALLAIALLGRAVGAASDVIGFAGLGLIGPSQVLFGLGMTRVSTFAAVGGIAIILGWFLPLIALFVPLAPVVCVPLGAAWILVGLVQWRDRSWMARVSRAS
jgi:hypothetical protein